MIIIWRRRRRKPNILYRLPVWPGHIWNATGKLFCNGQFKIGDGENALTCLTSTTRIFHVLIWKGERVKMGFARPTMYSYKHIYLIYIYICIYKLYIQKDLIISIHDLIVLYKFHCHFQKTDSHSLLVFLWLAFTFIFYLNLINFIKISKIFSTHHTLHGLFFILKRRWGGRRHTWFDPTLPITTSNNIVFFLMNQIEMYIDSKIKAKIYKEKKIYRWTYSYTYIRRYNQLRT